MPVLIDIVLVVGGLVLLAVAADWLVRGSVAAATALKVPHLLIGLTVVALGTSAPELVTGIRAAMVGEPGIVLGNAIGSNAANLGLVLGVAALMGRFTVARRITSLDTPILLGITAIIMLLAVDMQIGRVDGAILCGLAAILTVFIIRSKPGTADEVVPDVGEKLAWWMTAGLIIVGLGGLAIGAAILVRGAQGLASLMGLSGTFIGATVVALGTSAPELAATIAAARQRHYDIVLGNLIGSCQLNLALIVGIPALIAPLDVDPSVVKFHLPALIIISLAAWLMMRTGRQLIRREGAVALVLYLAYIAGSYLFN